MKQKFVLFKDVIFSITFKLAVSNGILKNWFLHPLEHEYLSLVVQEFD